MREKKLTPEVRELYIEKIAQWKEMGLDASKADDLESLLLEDVRAFEKESLKVLKELSAAGNRKAQAAKPPEAAVVSSGDEGDESVVVGGAGNGPVVVEDAGDEPVVILDNKASVTVESDSPEGAPDDFPEEDMDSSVDNEDEPLVINSSRNNDIQDASPEVVDVGLLDAEVSGIGSDLPEEGTAEDGVVVDVPKMDGSPPSGKPQVVVLDDDELPEPDESGDAVVVLDDDEPPEPDEAGDAVVVLDDDEPPEPDEADDEIILFEDDSHKQYETVDSVILLDDDTQPAIEPDEPSDAVVVLDDDEPPEPDEAGDAVVVLDDDLPEPEPDESVESVVVLDDELLEPEPDESSDSVVVLDDDGPHAPEPDEAGDAVVVLDDDEPPEPDEADDILDVVEISKPEGPDKKLSDGPLEIVLDDDPEGEDGSPTPVQAPVEVTPLPDEDPFAGDEEEVPDEATILVVDEDEPEEVPEESLIEIGETRVDEPVLSPEEDIPEEPADVPEPIVVGDVPKRKKKRKKKDARTPRVKKSTSGKTSRTVAVILVVLVVMIASLAGFLLFVKNDTPQASLSLENLIGKRSGDIITFDASGSNDDGQIVSYSFDFGDGVEYLEDSSNAPDGTFDGKTDHFYMVSGNFNVTLEVVDDRGTKSTVVETIHIDRLTIDMSDDNRQGLKLGDNATYELSGDISIANPDGLMSFSGQAVANQDVTVTVTEVVSLIEDSSRMKTGIERIVYEDDGFLRGRNHAVLETYTWQDLDLTGDITVESSAIPGDGIKSEPFSADITSTDFSYSDLNENKTIFSNANIDTFLEISSEFVTESPFDFNDRILSYPDLQEGKRDFRMQDLGVAGVIRNGDSGTLDRYNWEVVRVDNIQIDETLRTPTLLLDVTLPLQAMQEDGIDYFKMQVWVAEDISFPVKTIVHYISTSEGGNVTTANIESTMLSFTRGTGSIPYGTCSDGVTSQSHFYARQPAREFLGSSHVASDYFPPVGGNSSSFDDFSLNFAIAEAKADDSAFSAWLDGSSAYLLEASYNEAENPLWHMTFGQKGEPDGREVTVEYITRIVLDPYAVEVKTVSVETIETARQDLGKVITLSSAERVFENISSVSKHNLFLGGHIDFKTVTFRAQAELSYASTGASQGVQTAMYGYVLEKTIKEATETTPGETFRVGMDATTGQIMYEWWHTGNDDGFFP